jgi:hypothetical protein
METLGIEMKYLTTCNGESARKTYDDTRKWLSMDFVHKNGSQLLTNVIEVVIFPNHGLVVILRIQTDIYDLRKIMLA